MMLLLGKGFLMLLVVPQVRTLCCCTPGKGYNNVSFVIPQARRLIAVLMKLGS